MVVTAFVILNGDWASLEGESECKALDIVRLVLFLSMLENAIDVIRAHTSSLLRPSGTIR